MPEQETSSEKKERPFQPEKKISSLVSFLTIYPIGNPLLYMTGAQRQYFFESLMNVLHLQRVENQRRTEALLPRVLPPVAAAGTSFPMNAALKKAQKKEQVAQTEAQKKKTEGALQEEAEAAKEKTKAQGKSGEAETGAGQSEGALKEKDFATASPIAEKKAMEEAYSPLGGLAGSAAGMTIIPLAAGANLRNNPGALFSALYGKKAEEVRNSQDHLSIVINDYARGDEAKAKAAVADFKLRLSMDDYKSDELMAVLLLVIEDHIWAEQEGGIVGAKPSGTGAKIRLMIPTQLRETMKESANVRLASVREMLRYYFERHPKEYATALAAALGITADQEEDNVYLQERLASEIASIGSFALAQKILAEIKLRRKMGTKDCLRELGYRYDKKGKKLILGKRTCGSPAEAKGIIGLLLNDFKRSEPES